MKGLLLQFTMNVLFLCLLVCLFVCLFVCLWLQAVWVCTVCIFIHPWLCSQAAEGDFWVTWAMQKGTATLETDQKPSCDWQPGPAKLQGAAKVRIHTQEYARRTPLLFECLLLCDSWWLHQNTMELGAFRLANHNWLWPYYHYVCATQQWYNFSPHFFLIALQWWFQTWASLGKLVVN